MLPIALTYGLISGTIVITVMLIGFAFGSLQDLGAAQWLGYLIMLVALSLIFFGTKRYRDREFGGVIKFWPAFFMGLAIAAVASVVYVLIWEIHLQLTDFAFITEYANSAIDQLAAEGASSEVQAAKLEEMQSFELQYANPLFRIPLTFIEIFPVGVIVSLISSALLRNPKILPARA